MFVSVFYHAINTDFNYFQVHKDRWRNPCVQCYFKGIILFPELFMYGCVAVILMCFELFSSRRLKPKRIEVESTYQLHICKDYESSSVKQKKNHIVGDYTGVWPLLTQTQVSLLWQPALITGGGSWHFSFLCNLPMGYIRTQENASFLEVQMEEFCPSCSIVIPNWKHRKYETATWCHLIWRSFVCIDCEFQPVSGVIANQRTYTELPSLKSQKQNSSA